MRESEPGRQMPRMDQMVGGTRREDRGGGDREPVVTKLPGSQQPSDDEQHDPRVRSSGDPVEDHHPVPPTHRDRSSAR